MPGSGDRITIQLGSTSHVDLNSGNAFGKINLLSGEMDWTGGSLVATSGSRRAALPDRAAGSAVAVALAHREYAYYTVSRQ